MNKASKLRSLPAVDELVNGDTLQEIVAQFPRPQVVGWARAAIDAARAKLLAEEACSPDQIVATVRALAAAERGRSINRVINATGVLLHTNLGRAPLADRAIERIEQATKYSNVELDLNNGKRSKRGERAAQLIAGLAGAEDAIVVNNCAAATMLVLSGIAGIDVRNAPPVLAGGLQPAGKEVIVSRGQLVEIGGGFRLPDVFRAAGVVLREVGTTNRTHLRDYETAIGEHTGAILRVHRSNFFQGGFVTEPSIDEMVAIKRPKDVPVIDDLGSGCFYDLSEFGLREPVVVESVKCGADLSLFSGDKLFGGPQCGMIVGRKNWIQKLRTHPMMRAMRVDKVTLAALEATAEIHLSGTAFEEIPVLQMIAKKASDIQAACHAFVKRVGSVAATLNVVPSESQVGGGSIPGATMPSFAVEVSGCKTQHVAQSLRTGTPAVQSRLTSDNLLLDLRSVDSADHDLLAHRLTESLQDAQQ